jgi:hypothetical protein
VRPATEVGVSDAVKLRVCLALSVVLIATCAPVAPTASRPPTGTNASPTATNAGPSATNAGPSATNAGPSLPPLATLQVSGPNAICAGVGLIAVLRGNPSDPHLAWIEQFPRGGGRQEVIWPAGFSARFTPLLEILDETGLPLIHEGDFVGGACGSPQPGTVLLVPPLLALRLDCGPMPVAECGGSRIYRVAEANAWPKRAIAEVRFLTVGGRYQLVFEDGSEATGSSVP